MKKGHLNMNKGYAAFLLGLGLYVGEEAAAGVIAKGGEVSFFGACEYISHGHPLEVIAGLGVIATITLGVTAFRQYISMKAIREEMESLQAQRAFSVIVGQVVEHRPHPTANDTAELMFNLLARWCREAALRFDPDIARICIFRHHEKRKELVPVGSEKFAAAELTEMIFPSEPTASAASKAFNAKRALVARKLPDDSGEFDVREYKILEQWPLHKSVWCLPLGQWGVLAFYSTNLESFDDAFTSRVAAEFSKMVLEAIHVIESSLAPSQLNLEL